MKLAAFLTALLVPLATTSPSPPDSVDSPVASLVAEYKAALDAVQQHTEALKATEEELKADTSNEEIIARLETETAALQAAINKLQQITARASPLLQNAREAQQAVAGRVGRRLQLSLSSGRAGSTSPTSSSSVSSTSSAQASSSPAGSGSSSAASTSPASSGSSSAASTSEAGSGTSSPQYDPDAMVENLEGIMDGMNNAQQSQSQTLSG
uniref:Uncharacterized protein n=1 Tax=Chromera velia CCMP2878 TaxID=1169474 RepID=A0A0G4GTH9_9ALVE|eukprot:Cvel_23259.t1-p1 / transcript=Cvel_23259.t1 / gene=Cvel_23259 / organism=Chromera_velia_CCMP2878 / gene_product=hypothetical protein / transcript_product=hypothetical protein / location=Cvel_scaffold2377:24796-25751(-) / protein_length=210 / sequence_SO=supercontig / SO=protein_coding / is_pseudo=false